MQHPLFTHETRSLVIPGVGLRLGIVSDSHSDPHPDAFALIARERPDIILHAGDVGHLGVLDGLEEIAPVIAVRGNVDTRGHALPDAITLTATAASGARLRMLLTHIAVSRTVLKPDIRQFAAREDADLVICGHSHTPLIGRDGRVGIFNPGSMGPRRFQLPITFGVLELSADGLKMRHVDCETGADWSPLGASA